MSKIFNKKYLWYYVVAAIVLIAAIVAVVFLTSGDKVTAIYNFATDKAGYGEGEIVVTPKIGAEKSGWYNLYFANDNGILNGYEYITSTAITGDEVKISLVKGMVIPNSATSVYLYEVENQTDSVKDLKPSAKIEIPEDKQNKNKIGDQYFSFASVSDVHMEYYKHGAAEKWPKALDFFAEKEMNMVVLSGDMTGSGRDVEYESYNEAISKSSYPKDKIFESRGNHDAQGGDELFVRYTSGEGEVHPFENSPYYYVLAEGENGHRDNLFIFMAQQIETATDSPKFDNFNTAQLDWVEGLLEEYSEEANIFLIQHATIREFGAGDIDSWGYSQHMLATKEFPNNLRFKNLLTEYKNVIMISGHTHLSLYELVNYSNEDGNAARMIHNGSVSQPKIYNEAGEMVKQYEDESAMTQGSEGYLVYVCDDAIIFTGYNLTTGLIIPQASYILEVV